MASLTKGLPMNFPDTTRQTRLDEVLESLTAGNLAAVIAEVS